MSRGVGKLGQGGNLLILLPVTLILIRTGEAASKWLGMLFRIRVRAPPGVISRCRQARGHSAIAFRSA